MLTIHEFWIDSGHTRMTILQREDLLNFLYESMDTDGLLIWIEE